MEEASDFTEPLLSHDEQNNQPSSSSLQETTNEKNHNHDDNNNDNVDDEILVVNFVSGDDESRTTTQQQQQEPPPPLGTSNYTTRQPIWSPSGSWWKDWLHFVGPGWLVSIAYVDPGNYQADLQAGATTQYTMLFAILWTSLLSIYVQILCVRLTYYSRYNLNLAQVQAQAFMISEQQQQQTTNYSCFCWIQKNARFRRHVQWIIAELSIILTDLPEVIGFSIACQIVFGWSYSIGVVTSLITTMIFLATLDWGIRVLEAIVALFVGIMSLTLCLEVQQMGLLQNPTVRKEIWNGLAFGFVHITPRDVFVLTGILGAVVMPHNLYLHSAACQTRPVQDGHVKLAVRYSSWEPVLPILVSFVVNLAVVAVAAESSKSDDNNGDTDLGITNFCQFLPKNRGHLYCALWATALWASGQSSAITTTFTGQYVMDGFLFEKPLSFFTSNNIENGGQQQQQTVPTPSNSFLSIRQRAILTRLVAIVPCIIVSLWIPNHLDEMVNIVNSALAFLLPFALTPLVKYTCCPVIMKEGHVTVGCEKYFLYGFALVVWAINAVALSVSGGGFFGDLAWNQRRIWLVVEIAVQLFYFWWNIDCLFLSPVQHFNDQNGTEQIRNASEDQPLLAEGAA